MGLSWGRRSAAPPVSSPARQDRCKDRRTTTVQHRGGRALLPRPQPPPTTATDPRRREERRVRSWTPGREGGRGAGRMAPAPLGTDWPSLDYVEGIIRSIRRPVRIQDVSDKRLDVTFESFQNSLRYSTPTPHPPYPPDSHLITAGVCVWTAELSELVCFQWVLG